MEIVQLDREWMKKVSIACQEMDILKADALMQEVAEKRHEEADEDLLGQIREYLYQYDYDDVIALIHKRLAMEEV